MASVPYPLFFHNLPVIRENASALSSVGRCRINPKKIQTLLRKKISFQTIFHKTVDQANEKNDLNLKKRYMKESVSMAYYYLSEDLSLDTSIIDVEIVIESSMILESDGCIVSCFLDAGCDKIVVPIRTKDDIEAIKMKFLTRNRLVAHFTSVQDFNEKLFLSAIEFTNTMSVAFTKREILGDKWIDVMTKIKLFKYIHIVIQIDASFFRNNNDILKISDLINNNTNRINFMIVDPSAQQLGNIFVSCIRTDRSDGLYPTVVCTRSNEALGLVYSSNESIIAALKCGRGVYYSRSRNQLWRKGDTSGHYQKLHRIDLDCDKDAIRFIVTQCGNDVPAFCHLNTSTCWGKPFGIRSLELTLKSRIENVPKGSYTARLLNDDLFLRDKLVEEAQELSETNTKQHTIQEFADILYFALVKATKNGICMDDVVVELDKRSRKVTRRKGDSKSFRIEKGNNLLKFQKNVEN